MNLNQVVESEDSSIYDVRTHAAGPAGSLPITAEMLIAEPSGNLFGLTQNAGMGWNPAALRGDQVLILSTHGGVRAEDGTPIALGYHTGHWEVGLLVAEAARELKAHRAVPFAGACTDPCDGRSQGTPGMYRFPALSQRCRHHFSTFDSFVAYPQRRHWRSHLR